MAIGMILIGDELLSGKRRDSHMAWTIGRLHARGLELSWVRIVGDDPRVLVENFRQTLATDDIVLSFGGIGATPDDRTRQAVAEAAGVPLMRHPEAVALLEAKFGERLWPQRIEMAEFPDGAALIPNSYNNIPGFSVADHHFVPGFPEMAWPMIEWVLDHRYAHLHQSERLVEFLLRVQGVAESELVPVMRAVLDRHPGVRVSSLPDIAARHIEFGIRGIPAKAAPAHVDFIGELDARNISWQLVEGSNTDIG